MIGTTFDSRVKIHQVIQNQLPEFILDESPKAVDFLKQYFISQEYQGGPTDIVENLDQYLKLDNLTPEVVGGSVTLSESINNSQTTIVVNSTKGFPNSYGILKIDDEIITYKEKTETTFNGCIRGFSGVTNYHKDLEYEELVFSESSSSSHTSGAKIENLSVLFLIEFYKKLKYTFTPGLEDLDFVSDLNVGNFIKHAKTFYQSKGTEESFRILFNILFGVNPKIVDLEKFLIKSSGANYIRREALIVEKISGDISSLLGQTIRSEKDPSISGSISEIEIITRNNNTYYKILMFVGYDDIKETAFSTFVITPNTKCIDDITVGETVITVDSTLGFLDSSILYVNGNIIEYTSKSINQFFGCKSLNSNSISISIPKKSSIVSDFTYYGYENGDITKKVIFRVTGVLSDLRILSQNYSLLENDIIGVKQLGDKINIPEDNSNLTYKQIHANSWIYNTSSGYQIDVIGSSFVITRSSIHKSSIKVGDYVEIVSKITNLPVSGLDNVLVISIVDKKITLNQNLSSLNPLRLYEIRRKLVKSNSSIVPISIDGNENLNNKVFADVQNTYSDNNGEFIYVASNSLPSYTIDSNIFEYEVSDVSNYSEITQKYSQLELNANISFLTGDEIYYTYSDTPISGLEEGKYYVELVSSRKIRLYTSRNFIDISSYIEFGSLTSGTHTFTLLSQKEKFISPQKTLKKFKLDPDIGNIEGDVTLPGSIGMLSNGVEIFNYKSNDKIYYGPLESVSTLNPGKNYDVINPPKLLVSGNAKVQPILQGSIAEVYVDPQEFDIEVNVSIAVTGGNGKNSILKPIITRKRREVLFDARQSSKGGGVDITNERITFLSNHNFITGQEVTYDNNGNSNIGISSFKTANYDQGQELVDESVYFVKVLNNTTVQIHNTFGDSISGVNTVGFTTIGTSGIQKFKTKISNTLSEIKVYDGGEGFTNRNLRVNPSGISTYKSTINFVNHGFSTGEIVTYNYQTSPITGISTNNQYYVIKLTNNAFRICDAGIGATIRENYEKNNYVKFSSTGSGYQIFNYPPISVTVNYNSIGVGTTAIRGTIVATPVVKGGIVDTYVYEKGSDYGSKVLNFHKKPSIKVEEPNHAQIKPIISDGKIIKTLILYSGSKYSSTPDIAVIGDGTGAKLRGIIGSNGKLSSIIVVNQGFGYSEEKTSILVRSLGQNVIFNPNVRSLSINQGYKYGIQGAFGREVANELLYKSDKGLQYFVYAYTKKIQDYFNDTGTTHSPIIGWSYDGIPIYGPYGYTDPYNSNTSPKLISTGYGTTTIVNRPSEFEIGFFKEDYAFNGEGDLDEHNGRYCVTPEFPNGTYAYFATSELNVLGELTGKFPYFIGNHFRSKFISDNINLNQSTFDLNNSGLFRNTLPYNVNDQYAGNDFIVESNELINQTAQIESVSRGEVTSLKIIESGDNYKVSDRLNFDESNSDGFGINAQVSELKGRQIVEINTNRITYQNVVVTRKNNKKLEFRIDPYHEFNSGDNINISGITTDLFTLNGQYKIGFTTYTSYTTKYIPPAGSTGIVTFMTLPFIPENISIGSSIKIENEVVEILDKFDIQNTLKIKRVGSGVSHAEGTSVYFLPNSFEIDKDTDPFNSKNTTKVYFNPRNTLGIGTTSGGGDNRSYWIDGVKYYTFTPTQSIFIPKHPFRTGQKLTFRKQSGTSGLTIRDESGNTSILLLSLSQTMYAINKSKDYIGIATSRESAVTGNGVFFPGPTGTDNEFYTIESSETQILCDVNKLESTIVTTSEHLLQKNDQIDLIIKPNLSVGIGTTTSIKLRYSDQSKSLLVHKTLIENVNTSTNTIGITSHLFNTGDLVYYDSEDTVAAGLVTGKYYVCKIDHNNIKLSTNYYDCFLDSPKTVSITSSGGNLQELWFVNPKLNFVNNNNIIFDATDPSLVGYNFNLYYDNKFNNKFILDFEDPTPILSGVGTFGSSGFLTINHSGRIPQKLYYNLEKNHIPQDIDEDVIDFCEIEFSNSAYNGRYNVHGIGSTSFSISLRNTPEKLNYTSSNCDVLEYVTTSKSAKGPINKVKIISGGSNYNKLPVYNGVISQNGDGAYIIPKSLSIGRLNRFRIINEGFEYSSDKTLVPFAEIPKVVSLKNSKKVSFVDVVYGGKYYLTPPNLVLVNKTTGKKIDSGLLTANLNGNSIVSVDIQKTPVGIPLEPPIVRSVNNTNGVKIDTIQTSVTGVGTIFLATPIVGFATSPFVTGDFVFVEGVTNHDPGIGNTIGLGFNSADHGYEFFEVTNYFTGSNPGKLEFKIPKLYGNPGLAKTVQDSFATVVNKTKMPSFTVTTEKSIFLETEQLYSSKNGQEFEKRDLYVSYSDGNSVRLTGSYNLTIGELIKGSYSFFTGQVSDIESYEGVFDVSFSKTEDIGWIDDSGKISNDTQVIQDNDYYQNLSYTIKSSKSWEEIVTPVNNLVHPTGLKNFADIEVQQNAQTGIATFGNSQIEIIRDCIQVSDVTTVNNIDLVYDIEPLIDSTNIVKFQNLKLADYVECRTNRVLAIDDISPLFSSIEDEKKLAYTIVSPLSILKRLNKALIQIKEIGGNDIQISEIVVINDPDESFTLQRGFVSNKNTSIGDVTGFIDDFSTFFLKFDPVDTFNTDYELKILKTEFTTSFTGISTYSLGMNRLISSNAIVNPGITTTIVSFESEKFDSFYTSVHFYDIVTNEANYVELFVTHDNENTYVNEFYFDSNDSNYGNYIGSFGASLSNGVISLDFENLNTSNKYRFSSKTVGFGSTAVGIETYRFKYSGQPDGLEQTALYASEYVNSASNVDVVVVDSRRITSLKSTVRVSYGQTSALHQVLLVSDKIDVSTTQYPFVSIGATSGIGTFGGSIDGFDLKLTFYPDVTETNGANLEIRAFTEEFYGEFDEINIPPKLFYGQVTESFNIAKYFGSNSERKDRLNFTLNHNGTPIFQKEFDPSDINVLDRNTHTFNITDHFFSTGEELYYRPKSTYVGVGTVAVGIGTTENYLGITTDILPEKVYPIKIDNNQFRLSTKREYALAGIYVTFTSYGEGNAHQLEMAKKNEKAFITVANLTQYPLSWTPNYQTLQNNGGSIGVGNSIFALSGISSVVIRDVIKIDDEYMKIVNVGFGTTSIGPITFSGDVPLIEVTRGFCGTASSAHTDGSEGRIYKGSYNITGKEIFFTDPPRGNITDLVGLNESNLVRERAKFSGRVFLRKDYTRNTVYDNISSEFTGIGQTYTLTTLGVNTVGLGTTAGNGLIFINSIFQTPTTENPTLANYQIVEDLNVGITSVIFSGITSSNGQKIVSDYDQNQNQLPRGGLIVSLGSTPGLGYAPLVGAKVITRVDGSGTIQSIVGVNTIGSELNIDSAYYDHNVGVLELTTAEDHRFGETGISVATNSVFLEGLEFSCSVEHTGITSTIFPYPGSSPYGFIFPVIGIASDKTFTVRVGTSTIPHTYVGSGTAYPYYYDLTYGSGYRGTVSVAVTETGHTGDVATITATVGLGGTLAFNIVDGGTGYTNPQVVVPPPSYEYMPITGISRLGVGETTECGTGVLLNLEIGPSGSTVGIGTTLFEVSSFKITRSGFNFREGDVFTVGGLVTDRSLSQPIEEFKVTVLETFSDSFGAIQLGEMNYIDSIRNLQDGKRVRFPLYYNSELLSFESNPEDPDSSLIEFDALLVIFINGILQEPKKNYNFSGGTTFTFTTAPKKEDNVSIFFYVGTRDDDSIRVSVSQFIEPGDIIQINSNNNLLDSTVTQNNRTVALISGSDRLETNIYREQGIDEINPKPLYWTRKKKDVVINDEIISKARDSIEPQVYPTSKIIQNFNIDDTDLFIDNAEFFDYEEGLPIDPFDCLIINDQDVRVAGAVTAIVSAGGTISSLDIVDDGDGYSGSSVQVKISAPKRIGVGIGTTATATIEVLGGKLTNNVTITNPGFGYTRTNPPNVIAPFPQGSTELIKSISIAQGFDGVITGIAVTDGLNGASLALEFKIVRDPAVYTDLNIGYPIYINNTRVGSGVTSIEYNDNDTVAIGTAFLDNIYHIHGINKTLGIITCNVASDTSIVGIATTGTVSYPVGTFSWGRLSGFSRSNPVSIAVTGKTLDVGLSTFASVQRRGTGLRNVGPLKKRVMGL